VLLDTGAPDTPEKAATYLARVVGDEVPIERQRAFLHNGPPMISFVMRHSPLRFRWMEGYSDYYPELPDEFDGKLLGAELGNLNAPYMATPTGTVIPGLYAAGNASGAVMGYSYAGAGSTIGPAMTFGYVAANDIAGTGP
jgi:hypothetical protein